MNEGTKYVISLSLCASILKAADVLEVTISDSCEPGMSVLFHLKI